MQLDIRGMTCASCAAHVEKALNRVDGVTATVNFATEKATCEGDAPVEELVAAVESAGYHARPSGAADEHGGHEHDHADPLLTWRLIVAAVLAVPVIAMSMVPGLHFDGWQCVALVWRRRS